MSSADNLPRGDGPPPPVRTAASLSAEIHSALLKRGNATHGWGSSDQNVRYESIAEWKEADGMMTTATAEGRRATPEAMPPLPPPLDSDADAMESSSGGCRSRGNGDDVAGGGDDEKLPSSAVAGLVDPAPAGAEERQEAKVRSHVLRHWYGKAYDYWESETNCPPTVDGVLGGMGELSVADLRGSAEFLRHVKNAVRPELKISREENGGEDTCACECGAGIGRVTKGLLVPMGFSRCDLVESSPRLLAHAPDHIGEPRASDCRYFCQGLQDFDPRPASYDVIWIQWVTSYLTDEDAVSFLERCRRALRPGGIVAWKENTCEDAAFAVDEDDASVTRSLPYMMAIAEAAGFRAAYQRYQEGFPDSIFPVPMVALVPNDE